jgi:hypothetical protein
MAFRVIFTMPPFPWRQLLWLPINSSLQSNPRYKFSLKSENIEILSILIFIFKMAADKIGKISMFSNFNQHWYVGLFWSEELIGNDENCIQGHFYDARPLTIWRFCWQPFWKWWPRKNNPEYKFHNYQPIPHFKILLDIDFHWNLRPLTICRFSWRLFWEQTRQINRQIVNGLRFQWKSISRSILKWGIGW